MSKPFKHVVLCPVRKRPVDLGPEENLGLSSIGSRDEYHIDLLEGRRGNDGTCKTCESVAARPPSYFRGGCQCWEPMYRHALITGDWVKALVMKIEESQYSNYKIGLYIDREHRRESRSVSLWRRVVRKIGLNRFL